MTIGVIAKLTVAEGKNAEFETIFKQLVELVNANEAGCNFYQLHHSADNPQVYMVLEQYQDKAALEAHGSSEYFGRLGKELAPCMAAAPEIEYLPGV